VIGAFAGPFLTLVGTWDHLYREIKNPEASYPDTRIVAPSGEHPAIIRFYIPWRTIEHLGDERVFIFRRKVRDEIGAVVLFFPFGSHARCTVCCSSAQRTIEAGPKCRCWDFRCGAWPLRIVVVTPSQDLGGFFGGTLGFSTKKAERFMRLGEDDMNRILAQLDVKRS
jgi:hypothetical protein